VRTFWISSLYEISCFMVLGSDFLALIRFSFFRYLSALSSEKPSPMWGYDRMYSPNLFFCQLVKHICFFEYVFRWLPFFLCFITIFLDYLFFIFIWAHWFILPYNVLFRFNFELFDSFSFSIPFFSFFWWSQSVSF
jgi:hypothetical protein